MKSAKEALEETKHLPPQTQVEIVHGLTVRRTKGGIAVGRLHYTAIPERDPEINPAWRTKHRRTYSSQAAWDREQEIQDLAGGGELVFAETLITHWDKIVISDPGWRPHPEWDCKAGFDHGKTNPTALERLYVDFEGRKYFCGEYYMPGREIWQHAPEIARMADIRKVSECQADPTIFDLVHQQTKADGEAGQKTAKSTNDLYVAEGIELFTKYVGDRSDWSFAQRVLAHWKDLDQGAEPKLFIVCRYPNVDATHTAPMPGLHNWDCPNLLWEMMRTRKEKLTASQLMSRNPSEKIIDKDNHARDAAKYIVMSLPEPTEKTKEMLLSEALAEIPKEDVTSRVIRGREVMEQLEERDTPIQMGRSRTRRRP